MECGSRQRGFVPAWFMDGIILLTIVGVLLAIIVPVVFNFMAARAVIRAIATTAPVRAKVEAYINAEGKPPHDNAVLGLPAPSRLAGPAVQSIAVIDGELLVRVSGNHIVDGKAVVLSPVFDPAKRDEAVAWRCQDSALIASGQSVEIEGVYAWVEPIDTQAALPEWCRKAP